MQDYEQARDLYLAIKDTFAGDQGKKVMAHLKTEYALGKPHRVFVAGDPAATQYRLGMQVCPAALVHVVETPLDTLLAALKQPAVDPFFDHEEDDFFSEKTDAESA